MVFSLFEKESSVSLLQYPNAIIPSLSAPVAVTDVRLVQFQNVLSPISLTLEGNVTEVTLSFPENAPVATYLTPEGINTFPVVVLASINIESQENVLSIMFPYTATKPCFLHILLI